MAGTTIAAVLPAELMWADRRGWHAAGPGCSAKGRSGERPGLSPRISC
jgi:hypothetical protein